MRYLLPVALLLAAPCLAAPGPLLAPWGAERTERFALDDARGPWARRWVGRSDGARMMLTFYRSAEDARRVALLSRGLGDGSQDDHDRAFLRGFLPSGWLARGGPIRSVAYSDVARGLCVVLEARSKASRLCMASRPDSAVVATVMTGMRRDTAQAAAKLLARHAARHPLRTARVTADRSSGSSLAGAGPAGRAPRG